MKRAEKLLSFSQIVFLISVSELGQKSKLFKSKGVNFKSGDDK